MVHGTTKNGLSTLMFDSIVKGKNMPPIFAYDISSDASTGFGGEYSGRSSTGYCSASFRMASTDSCAYCSNWPGSASNRFASSPSCARAWPSSSASVAASATSSSWR